MLTLPRIPGDEARNHDLSRAMCSGTAPDLLPAKVSSQRIAKASRGGHLIVSDLAATDEPRDDTLAANAAHTTDAIAQLLETGRPVWPESAENPE
ncbi:MAG: hypothetical protein NT138_01955 [Planctomycetales bacterium]|nr:hypothetical protein [Planctomycetales bacterium]